MTSGDAGVVSRWLVVPRPSLQFPQRLVGLNWIQQGLLVPTAPEEGGSLVVGAFVFYWWIGCFLCCHLCVLTYTSVYCSESPSPLQI